MSTPGIPWRHRETGHPYRWLALAIDATPLRNGALVVVYCPEDRGNDVLVMDHDVFLRTFDPREGETTTAREGEE